MAAGSLLITEAGGLIGNFTGESDFMDHGECVAGNPRIYGQLVGTLGKYSKFAGAGDKARVRQAAQEASDAPAPTANAEEGSESAPAVVAKPTLKAKRIQRASPAAPASADPVAEQTPDAPF